MLDGSAGPATRVLPVAGRVGGGPARRVLLRTAPELPKGLRHAHDPH